MLKMTKLQKEYKTNILKIIIIGVLLLVCCNPFSFVGAVQNTKEVTVWICLGPSLKTITDVPTQYICIDSLEKYGIIENGYYKFKFDTLNVSHSIKSVHIYAKNSDIAYESRIPILFGEKKDIISTDIAVYISTESGENEAFCRENTKNRYQY